MSKMPFLAISSALALGLLLPVSAARAAPAHDTLGECYDYVVTQFNDGDADDWDGLDWALDNCDETYEEMVAVMPVAQYQALRKRARGGVLVILAVPQSGPALQSLVGDDAADEERSPSRR